MNRSRKLAIRIGTGIILLFVLVLIAAYALIFLKKDKLTTLAIDQIKKEIVGTVEIGELTPSFLRTFPNLSVQLTDVTIRDSLWSVHHHDFFHADKIFIRLQFFSLVTGKPKVGKVIIEDATMHLYTDECGYCNLNRREKIASKSGKTKPPNFVLYNTRLIIERTFVNAYHDFEFKHLDCTFDSKKDGYDMDISMKMLVHSLGFNLAKGSFLKEKQLDGDFKLSYIPKERVVMDDIVLNIDHQPFTIKGAIILHTDPNSYDLHISTEAVNYKKASGLLTQTLRQKVDSVEIIQPFNVSVTMTGLMAYKAKPSIKARFAVDDVDMNTTVGPLAHCSFDGSFDSQVDSLQLPGDENSKFVFNNIFADWSGIPITSSSVEVTNLLTPFLTCHFQSLFELKALNDLTESSTMSFEKGKGILDVDFNGAIGKIDTVYPMFTGSFTINDADIRYRPRDLLFQNCNGSIEFKNEDVLINNFTATAGKTELKMSGRVINLMALINDKLAQPLIEWNISTPDLNLNDFTTYVKQREQLYTTAKKTKKNKIITAAENLDRFLNDGTAQVNMEAARMMFKKFVATNVKASIKLVGDNILFDDVALNHADGKISMNGALINGNKANQLTLHSSIQSVNIPDLFQAFDNFGQDAITSKNMKGQMSAAINLTGVITDKAVVAENTMKGTVDFNITNGELNNFEPALKMAATAFKNRDFSDIKFGDLTSKLSINGSAFGIEKMEIRSNVVVLFVEGVYDTKKGTDMSIQVPLSNLSKAENDIINTGKVGVNVRLRAKTGEDGKLVISWDPFNSGAKKRKADFKNAAAQDSSGTKGKAEKG